MGKVKVNNLFKTYKVKGKKVNALNGMSFEIEQGEILGFLGPNGAGKSTTIKIMLDLIRADKGEVLIDGIDSRLPEARKRLGFMPENPQYFDTLTGFDLLMFSASMYGIDKDVAKKRAWELLEEFELKEAAKRPVRKYSKGMIQRVGFAAAIIHNPEILILDEPMSGLDPIGRVLFKNKMRELSDKGVTIFFSSHIIPDIEDICSRVIIVNKGKVVKSLTRTEIKYLTTTGFTIIVNKEVPNLGLKFIKLQEGLYEIKCAKDEIVNIIDLLKEKKVIIFDILPTKKDLENIFLDLTTY
ncbi:ABC transporter, ATP-binding protein [Deferribacter desulfuricans SSM1]|uniref:ABC transporter, ATP-binding protein n=1 Tax=Deferribacter desulfuricans (strain DSM 14783 / JCM 11476 / NBRC 101012 / SSM1) TaxID=639282 RepID=D3PDR6_DEFDS|nr:ABC transporter ATP-binding protein [Deferribacter desulfuricans]BAI80739.1 ABC transporter, ATP-binding protein [Deferribacter desulfuricans SSM1]